jgi:hypothetical protein
MTDPDTQFDSPAHTAPRGGPWPAILTIALVALAATVACRQVWNYDVFWHLASGRWMFDHGKVLDHDPFTIPVGAEPAAWVNIHWGFQVLATGLHKLGGWPALSAMKMVVFALAVGLLAWWLSRRAGPAWTAGAVLAVALIAEPRVRVRPELLTFLWLSLTLMLVESVREGASPRRLWWLVAINAVWVNMHGLYFVGAAATWLAIGGAWADRALKRPTAGRLTSPGALAAAAAATVAPFVLRPWPIRAALHPLLLRSRVSGEDPFYTFGVEEFRPTYLFNPFTSLSVGTLVLLTAATLAVLVAVAARRAARGQPPVIPIAHLLWLGAFGVVASMAIRNLMLLGIPAGIILALHGSRLTDSLRLRTPAHLAPAALLLAVLAAAAAYGTEAVYRRQGRGANRTGLGLNDRLHPVRLARWLGRSNLDGDVLCLNFGNGGCLIYHTWPERRVWMDGRLEVESNIRRFHELYRIRRNLGSIDWGADPLEPYGTPLPPTVRFLVVPAVNRGGIQAMSRSERFQLVFVDPVAVCFARLPMPGEPGIERLRRWHAEQPLPPTNLDALDRPIDPADPARPLLPDTAPPRWYRQNPPPAHWDLGALLFNLGRHDLAVRYLIVAERLGIKDPVHTAGLLGETYRRLAQPTPIEPDARLPADPDLARCLHLLGGLDLSDLDTEELREYALVRVRALEDGRQIDAAVEAMHAYLDALPVPRRWSPTRTELDYRNSIHVVYKMAAAQARGSDLDRLRPAERALLLLRRDLGLIDAAIAELESTGSLPPAARRLLADLYLRQGRPGEARDIYRNLAVGRSPVEGLDIRLRLCDWVRGDIRSALADWDAPGSRAGCFYRALMLERLGRYDAAAALLSRFPAPARREDRDYLDRLIAQAAARLKTMTPRTE